MTVKSGASLDRFIHSGVSMRKDEPDSVRVAAVARIRNIMNIPIGVKPFIALYSWDREILKISYGSIPYHDIFIRVKADADRPLWNHSGKRDERNSCVWVICIWRIYVL